MVFTTTERNFFYGIRTQILLPSKICLVCARLSFLKNPPKDDYERYARKVIDRAYFIILNKIDELDGTNEKLLEYYKENIEKYKKYDIMKAER